MPEYPQRGVAVVQWQISDGTLHFQAGRVRQVAVQSIVAQALKGVGVDGPRRHRLCQK